jgi:hypothetical protein
VIEGTWRYEIPSGIRYVPNPVRGQEASLSEVGHLLVPREVDDYYQAIMEDRPQLDVSDTQWFWDLIAGVLDETEMAVVEMTVVQGLTLREAGELLAQERGRSKPYRRSWMSEVRIRAMEKLRKAMVDDGSDD